ncbi:MAG: hypothetical protein AB7F99_03955 [Vicinamibacterales bacterium]
MQVHRLATVRSRALGIPVVVLLILWTATGFLTLFAGVSRESNPALGPVRRLPVDLARITIGPSEALARAALDSPPADARLLTVLDRPAYRFGDTTIFADSGERLTTVEPEMTRAIAARFAGVALDRVDPAQVMTSPDRWTTGHGRDLPLHKFRIHDDGGTEIYVSPRLAEVVAATSADQRLLSRIGDTHRLLLPPLDARPVLRAWIVAALSTLICVGAIAGAVRLLRDSNRRIVVRTAAVGMTSVALLWVMSGWLLMVAGAFSSGGVRVPSDTLSGRPVDARALVVIDLPRLALVTGDRPIREVEFVRIQDAPFLLVMLEARRHSNQARDAGQLAAGASERLLVVAETMTVRRVPFTSDSIRTRLAVSLPDVSIDGIEMLDSSDGYYSRGAEHGRMPVARVRFGDADATWVYVDPSTSAIVDRVDRTDRVRAWVRALHRLDLSRLSRLLRSASSATL